MKTTFVEPIAINEQFIKKSLLTISDEPAEEMRLDISITKGSYLFSASESKDTLSVQAKLNVVAQLENEKAKNDIRLSLEISAITNISTPISAHDSIEEAESYIEFHGTSLCYELIRSHANMLMANSPFPKFILPEIDVSAFLETIKEQAS